MSAGVHINWGSPDSVKDWLCGRDHSDWKDEFEEQGFLIIKDILNQDEVGTYRELYDRFLSGEIDATSHRHDLGSHLDKKVQNKENICQIMWPSNFVGNLLRGPFHQRALKCAKLILGGDMEFDFDMMISKAPYTDTVMPWHQDESYWPDLPDKRAVSFWLSLDEATVDNGCMQFVPGSHKQPMRRHRPIEKGHHALTCDAFETEFFPAPLSPGSCTLHHGRTIHYTKGNSTSSHRRALIMNARPGPMVQMEREGGFDHGKQKGVGSVIGEGQAHENGKC